MFYTLITLKPGGEVLKLRVEISVGEEEILIRCNSVDDRILRLQSTVAMLYNGSSEFSFFLGGPSILLMSMIYYFLKLRIKKFLHILPMECIIQIKNYMS